MQSTDIIPPEFYTFLKFSATTGMFVAGIFVTGVGYKLYKKWVGEEKAKKYRFVFFLANIPLLFLFVYIFYFLF